MITTTILLLILNGDNMFIDFYFSVYKCSDLESIYTLAMAVAIFATVCFALACIAAFLDFYIIKTYVAKVSSKLVL